jgi:hypothetical protein
LITRFLFLYLILILPRTVFASTTTAPGNTVGQSLTIPSRLRN